MTSVPARVITVSDRCSAGTAEDRSGPIARDLLIEAGLDVGDVVVVPDEIEAIQGAIRDAVAAGAKFVLTTGGTGVGPRDVTPEATAPLLELQMPGIVDAVRAAGRANTPMADLSRGLAGITARGTGAFVVNAPGSTGGVRDTVTVVSGLVGHVVAQLAGSDH